MPLQVAALDRGDPAVPVDQAAAQSLFARIDGDRTEPREIWIPTTLVRRGSGEIRPDQSLLTGRAAGPL